MMYVAANSRSVTEAYARQMGVNDLGSVVQVTSTSTLVGKKGVTVHVVVNHIDAEIETMLYVIGVRRLANVVYEKLT